MRTEEIIERLQNEPLPGSDQAQERTVDLAAGRRLDRSPRRPKRRAAVLGLLATVALVLSPPGQSLAESVGELVGIGEPASLPAEEFGDMISRGDPIVLASGEGPGGSPYEIVVGKALFPERPEGAPGGSGGEQTCLTVDLPETPRVGTAEFCVGESDSEFLASGQVLDGVNYADGAGVLPPEDRYVLTALLSPEVQRVELTYANDEGETVQGPTAIGTVDDDVRQAIGSDDRVGYMVGFVPDDGLDSWETREEAGVLGSVKLVGFSSDGRELARYDFGARFSAALEQSQRLATARALPRSEAAVWLALCGKATGRASRLPVCDAAEDYAAHDPELRQEAEQIPVTEEDGVLKVKLPNGDNFAMDSGG